MARQLRSWARDPWPGGRDPRVLIGAPGPIEAGSRAINR